MTSPLDREFENILNVLKVAKMNRPDQDTIDAWIEEFSKPQATEEDKAHRNEYAQALVRLCLGSDPLPPPFAVPPNFLELIEAEERMARASASKIPLTTDKTKKPTFQLKKMPCPKPKLSAQAAGPSRIPRFQKKIKPPSYFKGLRNEFEDMEEMAKAIARSKGQSFAEFVVAISRYSKDYGQELRAAMKAETTNFAEYVENVLSQRIKDLTEVLDAEQNAEIQKIRSDIDKWQMELGNCKKRIKEIIPDFDVEEYWADPNYLKKVFTVEVTTDQPLEDSFKKYEEESRHRLKWYADTIKNLETCNQKTTQEINKVLANSKEIEAREARNQMATMKFMKCEKTQAERLKQAKQQLARELVQYVTFYKSLG